MKNNNLEMPKILFANDNLANHYFNQISNYLKSVNEAAELFNNLKIGEFGIDEYNQLGNHQYFENKYLASVESEILNTNFPDVIKKKLLLEINLPEGLEKLKMKNLNYTTTKSRATMLPGNGGMRNFDLNPNWIRFEKGTVFLRETAKEDIKNEYFRFLGDSEDKTELYKAVKRCEEALNYVNKILDQTGIVNTKFEPIIGRGILFEISPDGKALTNWEVLLH